MSKINRYTKAMRQLKSPLKESVPTNSMQGIYVATPFVITPQAEILIQGVQADYTQDDSAGDTSGLFDAEGNQLTGVPPITNDSPDNSYILGPMASMWYSWGNFSTFGYIRESDRRMVNLGKITGPLHTWDKTSNFTSYGQLTLEQAVWFTENKKYGDVDNNYANANYRAFYPGPPSSSTDEHGRYWCTITGVPKDPDIPYKPDDKFTPGTNMSSDDPDSPLNNIVPGSAKPKGWLDKVKDAVGDAYKNITTNADLQKALRTGAKIADVLWTAAEVVTGAKAAEIIADLTLNPLVDAAFGFGTADSAGEYNTTLATSLMTTVVTGKNQQIKLSKNARQDLVNSIDIKALEQNLVLSKKPKVSSDNAVNPNSNKSDAVLTGSWGAQGGVEVNYNPDDGHFTVTAVKMLRDFGNLDQKNADGKITNFEDIPNPTTDQIKNLFASKGMEKPLKSFYNMVANAEIKTVVDAEGIKPFAGGYDPKEAAELMYNGLPEITKALYNFAVEGSASNAVHLRNKLTDAGVSQSEIEKAGAGFGGYVYSQESYSGSQLPKEIKKVINKKMDKYLGFESYTAPKTRKLLREIKKPYVMPEEKKVKLTGYKPKLPNKDKMRQIADSMNVPERVTFAKAETGTWKAGELERGRKSSQAKKNEVLELMGQGEDSWVYMTETSRKKSGKAMYENFTLMNEQGVGTYKINRKEPLRSDFVLFLEYQDGTKSTMLQSELNEKMSDQSEKWRKDWKEPIKYEDQPAFKKVKKILSKEIPMKDIQPEFPKKAPPKLDPETQMHPDMFKRHDYFTKLDPDSAKTMAAAPTGDPQIDSEVEKAKKKPK